MHNYTRKGQLLAINEVKLYVDEEKVYNFLQNFYKIVQNIPFYTYIYYE